MMEDREQIERDIERLWIEGQPIARIAQAVGRSVATVNRAIAPMRRLALAGGYDREIAAARAAGHSGPRIGQRGRPADNLTDDERALIAEFREGKVGATALAAKYGVPRHRVYYLTARQGPRAE